MRQPDKKQQPAKAPQFAAQSKVSVEQSKHDIEKLLRQYGATTFVIGWSEARESVSFEMQGRRYRFDLAVLTIDDIEMPTIDSIGRPLTSANMPGGGKKQALLDQAQRTRWRELLLGIKAKLVMAQAGITTVETEFLPYVVLPNQQTMAQWVAPYLKDAYERREMPPLLPGAEPNQQAIEE